MVSRTQDEIMTGWDNSAPLVTIRCITYNHEKYIMQAIDGFLSQKTTFPFEVLVHDDASTDGTAVIIRKYEEKFPKIIKPIYQIENQYSKHDDTIVNILNSLTRGKYIAICEGDDYWIDENKLQMQVDFLENNPEYTMCYTKARQYVQSKQKFFKKTIGGSFLDFEDLLVNGNRVPTLTTVYRKDLLDKYQKEIQPNNKGWSMGDYPMWLYFAHESKVKFIDKVTAVYRVLENSASHNTDIEKVKKFNKNVVEIQDFFSDYYSVNCESKTDDEICFYVYINFLTKEYNKDVAKKVRDCYRKLDSKNIKLLIYYVCSYSSFLWKLLRIFKEL